MDTQKVTAKYRMSQWAQIIQGRQDSGQNIKDFCQETGISRNAYFYWQRKLRAAACTELVKKEESRAIASSGWMRLAAEPIPQEAEALEIEINGCRITVTSGTNHELLTKVCRTLRSV